MTNLWKDVAQLESLTTLNLELAMSALDDSLRHLADCEKNLIAASKKIQEITDEEECDYY